MPKITIREKDFTGNEALEYLDYTVLVPGVKIGNGIAGLYDTKAKFDKAVKEVLNISNVDYKTTPLNDVGFIMARELLGLGLSVVYVDAYHYTTKNNETVQKLDVDLTTFFDEFSDKGKYDLRFVTTGGLDYHYAPEAYKAAIKCAGDRGDAVAVLSVPEAAFVPGESGESGEELKKLPLDNADIINKWVEFFFKEFCNTPISRINISAADQTTNETYGRYASMFAPACDFPIESLKGNAVSKATRMPASFAYLTCFAKYINNYSSWFAMAGSIRGVSPYSSIIPAVVFGDADIDVFQVRTATNDPEDENKGHIAINAVCNIRPYGNIVWGNRTMHPLLPPEAGEDGDLAPQLVASSFLNIRHLCSAIKKQLYRSARRFTFQPNSDVLWIKFKGSIEPLLEEMKANQGIKGYQIIKVKTNKKALLKARIRIIPIEAVEDFDLTIELADSIEVNE